MRKKYNLLPIALLASILVGCTDVFDRDFEFDEHTPSVIVQANQLIESGKIKVSLLNLERAYMSETEKNSKVNAKADFSIEWNDYRVKTEGTVDVVYVPIKLNKKKNQIFTLQTEDGRMKGFSHQFYCTLIMVAGKDGKGFDAVMATYLYGGNMKENDIKRMGRDFESAAYTGYYITSSLDGTMLAGRYFEDGENKIRFRQNPLPPSERKEVTIKAKTETEADADTIRKHNHNGLHIFLNVNPMKRAKMTRSSDYDMEWFMTHCSFCGQLWDVCTCVIVEDYPLCQYCHTDIVNGRCSQACDLCDLCLMGPYHSHYNSSWGGGYNPPSTGGGGNTYHGGDPEPEPDPEPSVNHTFAAAVYLQAANDAYDIINPAHPSEPACNLGVQEMSRQLFNGVVLEELNGYANDIYNNLEASQRWQKINYTEANEKARQGYFVVAAWNSGSAEMGHVDTILPGHTGTNWDSIFVMDTGWAPWTNDLGQSGNARSKNQNIKNSFGIKKRTGAEGSFGIYYYK